MYIMVVSAPQHKSAAAVSTVGGEGGGRVAIVVEDQMHRASHTKTNVPKQQPYHAEQNQVVISFQGSLFRKSRVSKQSEKEEDVLERASKKISPVAILATESVEAESTESSKVETPDAAPTISEKEELDSLVVAADGPGGVAARKVTTCP